LSDPGPRGAEAEQDQGHDAARRRGNRPEEPAGCKQILGPGLAGPFHYRVVVSADFAGSFAAEWRSLGRLKLRGVGDAIEVFSLDDLR
jgi:hypothetical protein